MDNADQETVSKSTNGLDRRVRLHRSDEPLSRAAEKALHRRTLAEHQEAIDRALHRP